MKKLVTTILLGILVTAFYGCDTENAPDCFQTEGTLVEREFDLDVFKKIIVWKRVKLVVSDGPEQKVVIRAGENLFNEIKVRVEDSILKVSDRNSCNFVRDYEAATVFVSSPDLVEIRNSSGLTVENIGPLGWERLALISEDQEQEDEFHIDGDFNMQDVNVVSLRVEANGLSTFRLKGNIRIGFFGAYDGDVRIEAGELITERVILFHRSTNKMIVNPQLRIRGTITGLGDVIAKNRPPQVEVEELFTGRLIFE